VTTDPAATPQAIKIVDFAFDPVELSVAAGSVVTWTNDDAAVHNVDSGDGVIASPDLEQDGAYEVTLDQPGTIEYQCNIHEYMKGSITVTP
jgi:plastocyanin